MLPRIDRFQNAWPDTEVRLDTNHKPVDFVAQRVDIGVRYGTGNWPGLVEKKLMDEEVYPVCSPSLLQKNNRLATPADLTDETLIHDLSMESHTAFPSWPNWLRSAGVDDLMASRGLRINNSAAVLQAAIDGHGIALARSAMVHDDIQAKRLVRLFPERTSRSPLAYYALYRHKCEALPKLAAFRDWLFAEAAGG